MVYFLFCLVQFGLKTENIVQKIMQPKWRKTKLPNYVMSWACVFKFWFWSIFWSIVEKPIVHPKLFHSLPLFVGVLLLRLPQTPLRPREFQLRLSNIGISLIPKFRREKILTAENFEIWQKSVQFFPLNIWDFHEKKNPPRKSFIIFLYFLK